MTSASRAMRVRKVRDVTPDQQLGPYQVADKMRPGEVFDVATVGRAILATLARAR